MCGDEDRVGSQVWGRAPMGLTDGGGVMAPSLLTTLVPLLIWGPPCLHLARGLREGGTGGLVLSGSAVNCIVPYPDLYSRLFSQLWGSAQPTV